MRRTLAIPVFSLVAAARLALAAAPGEQTREIPLKLVTAGQPGPGQGMAQVRLDAKGEGSIPFENAAGKLLVRFADGKVFVDVNADGKIDDADGEGLKALEPGPFPGSYPTFKVAARIAGQDAEYPLSLFFARQEIVILGSDASLRGKVGDATVTLFDSDVNGSFSDVGRDGILVTEGKTPAPAQFLPAGPGRLGRVAAIGGELFNIEVKRGGASLGLSPYEGEKATLTLKTRELVQQATLMLAHRGGLFTCQVASGAKTVLPAGDYTIVQSQLGLKLPQDGKPAPSIVERFLGGGGGGPDVAMLAGGGDATTPVVTMRAGENEVSPGHPLKLEFTARAAPGRRKLQVTDASIVGGMGERYRAQIYAPGVESTLTVHVRAGGRERRLSKLEYG
ncbi:MAG: hypothetical protein ACYTKD_22605 [Planctomycetota bacterium]|jgi:hypothetical protein